MDGVLLSLLDQMAMLPYREFLFPEERWRSPVTSVAWSLVSVLTVISIFLGWDFFHSAFRGVAFAARGSGSGSWVHYLNDWLRSSFFLTHLIGALVGVLWALIVPVDDTQR